MKKNKANAWRCLNYGRCDVADSSEAVELPPGSEFLCPKCGGDDGIRLKPKPPNFPLFGLLGGAALLVIAIIVLLAGGGTSICATCHKKPCVCTTTEVCSSCGLRHSGPCFTPPLKYPNGIERQVLVRPDAVLYRELMGTDAAETQPNTFDRYYVYGDDPQSDRLWVGRSNVEPDGWLKRDDTMEWKHSTIVSFNEMGNRHPVLFFREMEPLHNLVKTPASINEAVTAHYANIESHIARGEVLPPDYPIICIEPRHHTNEPLIMPVLDARMPEDASLGRMLRVAAAGESRGETSFQSERYVQLLRKLKEAEEAQRLSEVRVDVDLVFVIDMTGTMQPWVDELLDAVKGVVAEFGNKPDSKTGIRFGLWGFQDKENLSGIQFRTKNFTHSLKEAADFRDLLETIKVNRMTPDSYPEDVFAGMTDAIRRTSWRDGAQRVMILIGDAPGHTTVKLGGREEMNAPQVRQLATDAGVQIASIAVKDSSNTAYVQYHVPLEEQFKELARNPGLKKISYIQIDQAGTASFRKGMEDLLGVFLQQPDVSAPAENVPTSEAGQIARSILESARARIVSAEVNESGEPVMPRDIDGWVYELDLLDSSVRALEPKLLVTRSELNTLVDLASEVVRKLDESVILGTDFYGQLLDAVAGVASGGRASGEGSQLPAFLQGLPYQSDMMGKSAEWFQALDNDGRQQFISKVKAKLTYYRMVNETPTLWRSLSQGASFRNQVAEIPFSQLP